jgi:hypothetical protein
MGWVKWKRDYGDSWEVDCVVVGASYGAKGKAGGLGKFLCALLQERVPYEAASDPVFLTFCRVHSGLNVRFQDSAGFYSELSILRLQGSAGTYAEVSVLHLSPAHPYASAGVLAEHLCPETSGGPKDEAKACLPAR